MEKIKISTDKNLLDIASIHSFLSEDSYWAQNRSYETVQNSINNSICFGVYTYNNEQIGFARVVTDLYVFAYIMDVFILKKYRGRGYGKQLMNFIVNYSKFSNIEKMALATADAHGLYEQSGFTLIKKPENFMELVRNKNSPIN